MAHLLFVFTRKIPEGHIPFVAPDDYLIVNVCNVLTENYIESKKVLHDPSYDIQGNICSSMAHVGFSVNGRSALVPKHF